MNSSPLPQMLPQLWVLSCRAFLIPTWGSSSESLHCGQAGDICWLQDKQGSPFPKHPVYPKATVGISTRKQDPLTALTFPFLLRHQNPPKSMACICTKAQPPSSCSRPWWQWWFLRQSYFFRGFLWKPNFTSFQRGLDDNWSCPRHPNLTKLHIPPYQMCLPCNSQACTPL